MKLGGFPLNKAIKEYAQLKRLNREDLIKWRQRKLEYITRYHSKYSSLYSQIVKGFALCDYESLPLVTKYDFQTNIRGIVSQNINPRDLYFSNTSGSSGHPFSFAKDKYSHAMAWAVKRNRYIDLQIPFGCKEARFYGIPLKSKSFYKEKLKDVVMNRVRFPVHDFSKEVLEDFIVGFRKHRFKYIYGYANSIFEFAKFLNDRGIVLKEICPNLALVIVTAEMCTSQERKVIENAIGVKVINEYGCSEFGNVGFQLEPDSSWVVPESLYVEVIPKKGIDFEKVGGDLLITDLYNHAFPFIRYKIGDIANVRMDEHGRQIIYNLQGRTNDIIRLPSGKESSGLTIYYISRNIIESSNGTIKEFIVTQKKINTFLFKYMAENELNESQKDQVRKMFNIYLEPGLVIDFSKEEKIERPVNGKIQNFYSEIK